MGQIRPDCVFFYHNFLFDFSFCADKTFLSVIVVYYYYLLLFNYSLNCIIMVCGHMHIYCFHLTCHIVLCVFLT